MIIEWTIEKNAEKIGSGLIEILSQYLTGEAVRIIKTSVKVVFQPSFEPGTPQIKGYRPAATPAC
jgi:hypothetical protein